MAFFLQGIVSRSFEAEENAFLHIAYHVQKICSIR